MSDTDITIDERWLTETERALLNDPDVSLSPAAVTAWARETRRASAPSAARG